MVVGGVLQWWRRDGGWAVVVAEGCGGADGSGMVAEGCDGGGRTRNKASRFFFFL